MTAYVDIDNVLADYTPAFVQWATKGDMVVSQDGLQSLHPSDLLNIDDSSYRMLKHHWRADGHKRTIPVLPDAKDALDLLSEACDVVFVSKRPANKYGNIAGDTEYWAKTNKLHFDDIIFVDDKASWYQHNVAAGDAMFDDDMRSFAFDAPCRRYVVARPYNHNLPGTLRGSLMMCVSDYVAYIGDSK